MRNEHPERLIHAYLERVSAELNDISPNDRQEIVDDLRSHILESLGDPDLASEVDVRNTLERLGDPEEVAREARERVPEASPVPARPPKYDHSNIPSALEVAAIVLTALFWPIGVLLAWVSNRWKTRDKIIATAIPFATTMLLVVVAVGSLVLFQTSGGTDTTVGDQPADQPVPADPEGGTVPPPEPRSPQEISGSSESGWVTGRFALVVGFLAAVVAGPFISAVFLAIRMQPVSSGGRQNEHYEHQRVPAQG